MKRKERVMKKIPKILFTFMMMFLFIGLGVVKTNAAPISLGESKTGMIGVDGEREFIFKIEQPTKVKITLWLGENQNTEFWDETDYDYLLISLFNESTVDEIFNKESQSGIIFSKTVSLKKGRYSIGIMNGDATMSYNLKIENVSKYAKQVKLNKKKAEIYTRQTLKLKASPKKKGYYMKKVQWKSSNKKIATVDKNGKVIGKKPGTCIISAKVKGGKSVKCKVVVKKRPDIVIRYFEVGIDYAGGIKPEFEVQNNTKKTIKYIYATIKFYNAVGDAAYCEITGKNYANIRAIGPIKSNQTETYGFNPIGYNGTVGKITMKTVTVEFMDGSKKTYTVNKIAKD